MHNLNVPSNLVFSVPVCCMAPARFLPRFPIIYKKSIIIIIIFKFHSIQNIAAAALTALTAPPSENAKFGRDP